MNKKYINIQIAGPTPGRTWPLYSVPKSIMLDSSNTVWFTCSVFTPVLVWEQADMYNKSRLYV